MTKSQCYSEIARNDQLIKQYQSQINTLKKEISELNTTKTKVSTLKKTLSSCKKTSVNRLSSTGLVMKINSKIVNKFCSNMNSLLSGSEYNGIYRGLTNGISRIVDEIAKKEKQIKVLQNNIATCKKSIANMNATIGQIETQEREEARRKAEEAAKNS